jgi:hypothetical protein
MSVKLIKRFKQYFYENKFMDRERFRQIEREETQSYQGLMAQRQALEATKKKGSKPGEP